MADTGPRQGKPSRLRIIADYQLMSDMEGREWLTLMLNDAADSLVGWKILEVHTGAWGLQYCLFWVDVPLDGTEWSADMRQDEAREKALDFICEIVSDSDASIRWIAPMWD